MVSYSRLRLALAGAFALPSGDFPWNDPDLISDSEFTTAGPQFHSGSLGSISVEQAYTTVRGTSNNLAEDGDGLLMAFPANTPRITTGRGYWGETSSTCRGDVNGDLSVVEVWDTDNCTITKDLPSPFAAGSGFESVAGCCINVTANGTATVMQTMPPFSGSDESHPHWRLYLPTGVSLSDDVEITQDNVLWTPVTNFLVVDRWKQIGGAVQTVTLDNQYLGVRLKNAKAGDRLGATLGNIERGYLSSTSIYTPSTPTVNRNQDVTTMNLANYPLIYNKPEITVFVACRPWQLPLPGILDAVHPRVGGTVFEINNPHDITAVGVGGIIAGVMTITAWTSGAFVAGDRPRAGTGVANRTDILEQLTQTDGDPPGRRGTYSVYSELYPDGQTTSRQDIVIESRLKNAQGLGLNWARKPDDPDRPGIIRIGLTVSAEPDMQDFGNDPQNVDLELNNVNVLGFTIDLVNRTGWVALNGDTEPLNPVQFTHAPQFNSGIVVNLGSQYPAGGPVDGEVMRKIVSGRLYSRAEMAAGTLTLNAKYRALALSLGI